MKLIKNFCLKVLNEFENHLAKYIAGFIILGLLALCLFSWRWLASKHSLEMLGCLWVLMFLAMSGLPILLFWLITRKPLKVVYTDENDIKNMLELRFREFNTNYRGIHKPRLSIRFTLFDRISSVKGGSSKKHLEAIANNLCYHTIRKGDKTIVFEYKKRSTPKRPGFLDNLY